MVFPVIVRSVESFELCCAQSGAIGGEFDPRAQRGTVRFGTERAARIAVALCGISATKVLS